MLKTTIIPRVSETDALGHINNTVLPVWFEAARNPIFEIFNPQNTFRDWKLVIVNFNIDFVNQIYFGSDVDIFTWVKRIGETSLELYEEAHQSGKLCAIGKVVYVNYNFNEDYKERISDSIREKLNLHLYEVGKLGHS